jgi:purine-binding chemotaxis protein CheW
MRPLPIEPLAGAPPFVLGLSLIRGIATPVVDVGALVGAKDSPAFTRFVTLRLTDRRPVALAVEAVLGTRTLRGLGLSELPPLLRDANPHLIASIGALDRELLTVLETARLVPDATSGVRPGVTAGPEGNTG